MPTALRVCPHEQDAFQTGWHGDVLWLKLHCRAFAAVLVLSLRSIIAKTPVMLLPLPRHRKNLRLAVNQVDQRTSLIL
jgi:hypothetical protein